MTFQTMNLTNDRVLVKGNDVFGGQGQTILDATQWTELKAHQNMKTAQEDFDSAVEEFFAPLMAAAEKANATIEKPEDSAAYVVLDEGTEGVVAQPRQIVKLTKDSIVLRLIEQGNTDRLVWVGDDLEVLEVLAGTNQHAVPVASEDPHAFEPTDDPV